MKEPKDKVKDSTPSKPFSLRSQVHGSRMGRHGGFSASPRDEMGDGLLNNHYLRTPELEGDAR